MDSTVRVFAIFAGGLLGAVAITMLGLLAASFEALLVATATCVGAAVLLLLRPDGWRAAGWGTALVAAFDVAAVVGLLVIGSQGGFS